MKAAKKQFLITLLILVYTIICTAQDFHWAETHKGNYSNSRGHAVASDAAGNIYTTGFFKGHTDFNSNAGTNYLTTLYEDDIFVCKFDSSGALVWVRQMGGTEEDHGTSIAVDAIGNSYISGYFEGTADFDPGIGVANLSAVGLKDIFIVKLDPSGNFVWAKSIGGVEDEEIKSIALDAAGNVYATGMFEDTVDFDSGVDTVNLISVGYADFFICKLNASSGSLEWAKSIGNTSYNKSTAITVDFNGNSYTTGYFIGTIDFDPGIDTFNLASLAGSDVFVCKLDESGAFLWAKNMGGYSSAYGYSIAADPIGNFYIAGHFFGTSDFDPGIGVANLTSVGNADLFIAKLDSTGAFLWAKRMGGADSEFSHSIAVDFAGNVYATGSFQGTVDFAPGISGATIHVDWGYYTFIYKLNSQGDFAWVKRIGGQGSGTSNSLAVDLNGNVYATGRFGVNPITIDFDPGSGIANLTAKGEYDAFILKLNTAGVFVWAKQFGETLGSSSNNCMAVSTLGTIYTAGAFQGTVNVNPSAGGQNLIALNEKDIFVCKYDTLGNFLWTKKIGGWGEDEAISIAVDASDNVYVIGTFEGTVDFDPGSGVFNLYSFQEGYFILKLTASGNFAWAVSLNTPINGIAVSPSGNVYTTGYIENMIDFDPSVGVYNLTPSSDNNAFVWKLNSSGTFVWVKNLTGSGDSFGEAIDIDANEDVYITGILSGYVNFNTNIFGTPVTLSGNGGEFVCKLDMQGALVWADNGNGGQLLYGKIYSIHVDAAKNSYINGHYWTGSKYVYFLHKKDPSGGWQWWENIPTNGISSQIEKEHSIATDAAGNVYLIGDFSGTVDFDPDGGIYNLTSINFAADFILKLTSSGNFAWVKQIESSANSIQIDQHDNIYIAGGFGGTVDFDPGQDTSYVTTVGGAASVFKLGSHPLSITYTNFNSWNFYPNPTNDKITIEVSNPDEIIEIQILNSLGQLISNQSVNYVTNITLSLPQETGIYFVAVRAANGKKGVLKVIKE